MRLRSTGRSSAAKLSARRSRDSIGGTAGLYTRDPVVLPLDDDPMALGVGPYRLREALALFDQLGARCPRQLLERAQRDDSLAALDLDVPRAGDQPVDGVARADPQVLALVDRVAMCVGEDPRAVLGGVGEQDAVKG